MQKQGAHATLDKEEREVAKEPIMVLLDLRLYADTSQQVSVRVWYGIKQIVIGICGSQL